MRLRSSRHFQQFDLTDGITNIKRNNCIKIYNERVMFFLIGTQVEEFRKIVVMKTVIDRFDAVTCGGIL